MPPTPPSLVGGRLRGAPGAVADAVAAARAALPGWSAAPDRGRVLHEVAEQLDDLDPAAADRLLWYAGWTDKVAGLAGAVHPVDGPGASWSAPRPLGVVGVRAATPFELVDALGAVLAVGATAVAVGPPQAAALAEALARSELPPGVANLLVGDVDALGPQLVRSGVDGLDAPGHEDVDGVRVLPDGPGDRGPARLRAWTALTTVWHSAGR